MTVPTPPQLPELITSWLPGQRWFAGKGREFTVADLYELGTLTTEPYPSALYLVSVAYPEGDTDLYQVPLVRRPQAVEGLAHVLVGEAGDPESGQPFWWYDALHDKEVTGAWVAGIAAEQSGERLTFHRGPAPAEAPAGPRRQRSARQLDKVEDLSAAAQSLVLTAEQSNTSLVFDDAAILKVFRRVYPGVNPDIEIHAALSTKDSGARHIARLLGWITGRYPDGQGGELEASLGMLQEFFRTASDGWELAKISVRDLYAEADLHADEVGGDFAGEAFRLGVATAEVHADLADALPTGTLESADLAEIADAMRARLVAATKVVPDLAQYADGLAATYDALAAHPTPLPVQRVHGDFHLGQVLRTVERWVVLDFEGEPAKPLTERVALDSPLRDVAAMLRSFDYAARHLLADHPYEPHLTYRADEWSDRNRTAFCDGYAEKTGFDPRDDSALLRAYEADKAVYEAVYEARNRPSWLPIPLASLARITEGAAR